MLGNRGSRPQRWIGRGAWAVVDQALFAASNFGLNVVLARSLGPAEYGAYAVAYAAFVLLGTFHTALLAEPMLVFGTGKYHQRLPAYFQSLLFHHWILSALIAACLAIAGGLFLFADEESLARALLALAVASPLVLLQWLLRQACYVRAQSRIAAGAGMLYVVTLGASTAVLHSLESLNATSGIFAMAGASLLCSVTLWRQIRGATNDPPERLRAESRADHWRYGRWSMASSLTYWIQGNIFAFIVPFWGGLEAAGIYRALANLLMPPMLFFTATSRLLLPSLVRARGSRRFLQLVVVFLVALVGGAAFYWLTLGLFGSALINALYGESFRVPNDLVWLMGLLPIVAAVTLVGKAAVRSLERPRAVFVAYAWSSVTAVPLGLVLTYQWALTGAFVSQLLSGLVATALLYRALRLHFGATRKDRSARPPLIRDAPDPHEDG